jgi:cyclic pyranopterin phosphate synthase
MRTKSTRALPIDIEKRVRPEIPSGKKLTHLDAAGRPHMVDITGKADTARIAVARGTVTMQPDTLKLIRRKEIAKGDVLAVAQLAGIMAAKRTPDLIPLCHPILIDSVDIEFELDEEPNAVAITATVASTGKTGVEMEALTATAVAALTIYDMCKSVDRGIKIENIRLVHKSGGKSGTIDLE